MIEEPADFINELGTQFWIHEILTSHAKNINCIVYKVETKAGYRTFLLVDSEGNALFESSKFDDIACHIDMMKLAIKFDKEIINESRTNFNSSKGT